MSAARVGNGRDGEAAEKTRAKQDVRSKSLPPNSSFKVASSRHPCPKSAKIALKSRPRLPFRRASSISTAIPAEHSGTAGRHQIRQRDLRGLVTSAVPSCEQAYKCTSHVFHHEKQ